MGMFDELPISPDKTIGLDNMAGRRNSILCILSRRNHIVGRICGIAGNTSIKALADMKFINLFGVQQICQNSIGPGAAIPSIDSESVQRRLDRVQTDIL